MGEGVVDCPTQLTLMTWICHCSMTNTSEKYERTQQGNLLPPPPHLGNARKNAYFLGKPSLSAEDIIGKSLTKALKNIKNLELS